MAIRRAAYIFNRICVLCGLFLASLCYAQDGFIAVAPDDTPADADRAIYSYIKVVDGARRFFQHISWQGSDYARRYEIIIERQSGGGFVETLRRTTVQPFVEFSLEGGKYRYKVLSYDFLNRVAAQSDWKYVTVVTALPPQITNFTPSEAVVGETKTLQIVVRGQNFFPDSRVFLREVSGGTSQRGIAGAKTITPGLVQVSADFKTLILTVDTALLKTASYEICIVNPGEFQTTAGILTIEKLSRESNFFAALGYAPFFPASQGVLFEQFSQKFFPAGVYGRFGMVPCKFAWGDLGGDVSLFFNFLSIDRPDFRQQTGVLQTHINALYQKKLLDTLILNARLGIGITSLLGYHFIYDNGSHGDFNGFYVSASGEASVQWFPFKSDSFAGNLFADAGLRVNTVFAPEKTGIGYIGIIAGFGMKF
jgi:hypothetical protein